MTTGKDDLTKASQLGSKTGYPGCPECRPGDGKYRLAELGFSDALRYSGKMDVVDKPTPHEMYGFYLRNHTVALTAGENITGWEAHRACMGKASVAECVNSTFPPELYEDDFTAVNAVTLLRRKPQGVPWFLQVSFPGPHDPFLVRTLCPHRRRLALLNLPCVQRVLRLSLPTAPEPYYLASHVSLRGHCTRC